ncbi:MAG: hypothetical protein MW690_000103 [Methanophagales archaeon]|nr:hypothetical protein [Methanophagales archaeon]
MPAASVKNSGFASSLTKIAKSGTRAKKMNETRRPQAQGRARIGMIAPAAKTRTAQSLRGSIKNADCCSFACFTARMRKSIATVLNKDFGDMVVAVAEN